MRALADTPRVQGLREEAKARLAAAKASGAARILMMGLAYKKNVDDMRESPALEVFEILRGRGLDVALYDPLVPSLACDSVLAAARGLDALAILVPHDLIVTEIRYRKHEILRAMRRPNLLSAAGCWRR